MLHLASVRPIDALSGFVISLSVVKSETTRCTVVQMCTPMHVSQRSTNARGIFVVISMTKTSGLSSSSLVFLFLLFKVLQWDWTTCKYRLTTLFKQVGELPVWRKHVPEETFLAFARRFSALPLHSSLLFFPFQPSNERLHVCILWP